MNCHLCRNFDDQLWILYFGLQAANGTVEGCDIARRSSYLVHDSKGTGKNLET